MGTDITTLARRYIDEIWAKGNLANLDELVDDDVVLRDLFMPEAKGKDALRERVGMMTRDWTDNQFTIDEIIVSGDRVVIRETWRGVQKNEVFGVKPTGKPITCSAVEFLRVKNGKIAENISYMDMYGMLQQMGVVPPLDQLEQARQAAPAAESSARV
jgi:steroid delta-isomerase-like uncharacterized protein